MQMVQERVRVVGGGQGGGAARGDGDAWDRAELTDHVADRVLQQGEASDRGGGDGVIGGGQHPEPAPGMPGEVGCVYQQRLQQPFTGVQHALDPGAPIGVDLSGDGQRCAVAYREVEADRIPGARRCGLCSR
ncbi:hypothetical protein [Allokutzneria multivorans]|uniref:hypothetical protein n=1 Tax=Allokutzneria multivorans TaxID=1142134 RepID=UPI0031EB5516